MQINIIFKYVILRSSFWYNEKFNVVLLECTITYIWKLLFSSRLEFLIRLLSRQTQTSWVESGGKRGFGVPHYEVLCPFHVASIFKLTQMSHVPANVATSRTYEPRLMNSALSSLGFGAVGSVGGIILAPNCTVYFLRFSLWQLSCCCCLPAACVGVCESGRVCLYSALQSLLLVFSAAPTQFTAHSGMLQCKCCSEWKEIT